MPGKRGDLLTRMIRTWATENDVQHGFIGPLSQETVDAWIEWHDEQKPIVFEDRIDGDQRRITVFCTKCANVHHQMIEPGIRSYADKYLEAQCEGKYWNTEPYLYIDILPVSKAEKKLLEANENK